MVLTVRKKSAQSLIEEEKSDLSSSGSNQSGELDFDNTDATPDHGMYSPSASRSRPPAYDFSEAIAAQRN